ncbi:MULTISPECIES: ATP-binding protein [Xanthomonas]|uniref:histidine kinase n=1 Tax=Xanthomonas rydalmerensis TaxID=3046274 RepID=A0ABZ0JSF1_9XANT|nr:MULTISPECIES: ATP-binding protein [unclassified Xanthomonas]MBB5876258.1 signal transduction histidine kinase/CheY-like chemotaxis protein [Xanthomonas sp. 3498]MBB5944031.1 signal transduction histidine kinase/CheY-like chemotaxis protein [Xanthomonas sp. 3307]MXV09232.1 response regulator [Xanthomonas sp. LMG 9002]WOS42758.1 response regulator [Xanthomonas sp. DM-2023]WOS46944.1 response regulator [Xanthomonas sp. DM-2023]
MSSSDAPEKRVLVYTPIGRDGPASVELLRRGGVVACHCLDLGMLVRELHVGAAAVFLAEEGLFGADTSALFAWADAQPAWSDLPFVVLTSHQEQPFVVAWRRKLVGALRNVALLERPVQTITFTSTIKAALRARARQYEVRTLLQAQASAAAQLEAQVVARTRELEEANRLLRRQMDERARVEETLRQAQKIEALGQLTGGVAHDFNNLLMVISGGLAMLDSQSDPAIRKRLMDGMQKAAQRGAGLTRQLLAFSRRQELKPEPIDLSRQIGGMRELLDRSLRGDVHVDFDLADDLWPVEVDPGELELVVLNLAVNARDAMPNGGTIVVRARNLPGAVATDPDFIRLSIIDDGSGMAPEVKARVFEPFYTTKDIGKGSGLGLAQVHGFVQQSGGSIHIDSEPGRGTAIHLLLPRSHRAPVQEDRHLVDLQVVRDEPGQAGCVLLVEDDDEVAALVGEMLRQLGYEVVRAASAGAALGALANGRVVDIVFSDIMMPGGMNGLELVQEIRMRRGALPVLLTSGYAEAAKSAAEAQGVQILSKPYRLDELANALQQVRANAGMAGRSDTASLC